MKLYKVETPRPCTTLGCPNKDAILIVRTDRGADHAVCPACVKTMSAMNSDNAEFFVQAPEQRGDTTCEQCHGDGCSQCNDTLYYEEEAIVEQFHRDQALDRARLLHPDEVGW